MTGASEEGDSERIPPRGATTSLGIASLLSGVAAGGFVTLPLRTAAGPDSFELRLAALWTHARSGLRNRSACARCTRQS
jgi:hypothetical protein